MPKIPTAKQDSASTSGPMGSAGHPNVLKRNQACHQCRRRKLVGLSFLPGSAGAQEAPKNRYEKLENRINELEAMLKDQSSPGASKSSQSSLSPPPAHSPTLQAYSGATISTPPSAFHSPNLGVPQTYQPSSVNVNFTGLSASPKSFISSVENHPELVAIPTAASEVQSAAASFLSPGLGYDVFWPGWPRDLPSPGLVRHLVEAFFGFHPHAGRLFHVSTFVSALNLPPTHPNFPSRALLHAICAVGSLYTMAVFPTPPPDKSMAAGRSEGAGIRGESFNHSPLPDEIFGNRYKQKDHIDSFAEKHAKLARQTAEEQLWAGKKLIECVQALLIITWWYWCNARYAFMTIAQAIRASIPLGLNVSSPFFPISDSLRAPSLIPPPGDVVDDEVRRNTFWLLYAMERMGGCSNGWAQSLDDQDVSQLLPMKGLNFDLGALWSGSERQHALGNDILLLHPEDQVDSFSLYVKGSILLSRVKAYNLRFRAKRFTGDPACAYASSYAEVWEKDSDEARDGAADPRRTSGFIEIDHIASMFRQSFPHQLRNPIRDGSVDSHLYTACLMPHLCSWLRVRFQILEASRGVLDLIYAIRSTSFDVTLLDFFCAFCWFMAGRVLVRFWQAAQEANSDEQTLTLRAEVEYIIAALAKLGERVPLAHRYFLMLNEVSAKTCGVNPL
ncbi:hypothetical protein B0F90DRAFT_1676459 [Multifurca ochricompacta]|uniref:Xylanolytic transcriptional activator regulatory domain-containing protein n=1 Tax=Multifurca ochricompacta TaxID=376703 RepID=A0AAD4MC91_9AGAM|nr:hypothetical protein B0F90DRAFT_1676459 [Multifurca ochricompacta]